MSIPAVVLTGAPNLQVTLADEGSPLVPGSPAVITATVSNQGAAPTTEGLDLALDLPAGFTATALSGDGWSCSVGTLACQSSSVLGPAETSAVQVTVDVPLDADEVAVFEAVVSGGGELNAADSSTGHVVDVDRSAVPGPTLVPTLNPEDQSVTVGATATFSASATGTPAPTVAWEISADDGATWSTVDGATDSVYTTPALGLVDSGKQFRAVFSNTAGTIITAAATLTVSEPSISGTVTGPGGTPLAGISVTAVPRRWRLQRAATAANEDLHDRWPRPRFVPGLVLGPERHLRWRLLQFGWLHAQLG